MENLKNYMLLFRLDLQNMQPPSPEQMAEIKQAWGSWIGGIAQQARLVSSHQVGREGVTIKAGEAMKEGVPVMDGVSVSGNLVLKAKDLSEAIEMTQGCPILYAGGSVEVRDIITVH